MKKIILFTFILTASLYSQTKDPNAILNKVKENFNRVKDYSVTANIKVDVDFIKVPDMKATIYFKQPNKVKMDSKEFAMLPRRAYNFSPTGLLNQNYSALFVGYEKLDGKDVAVVKVIPNTDSSDVVLSKLWIDNQKNLVRKVESVGKRGGTSQIELKYDENISYPLPSTIKFYFELPKSNFQDPRQKKIEVEKKDSPKTKEKGMVLITYSDYKVNKGISDSFFIEKKK
ncbi:MAG: hypothetical protein NTX22_14650 [Ignavibacteriales bacterium]|nr:hypothetical protein [Ignavibacteriales bacterium]